MEENGKMVCTATLTYKGNDMRVTIPPMINCHASQEMVHKEGLLGRTFSSQLAGLDSRVCWAICLFLHDPTNMGVHSQYSHLILGSFEWLGCLTRASFSPVCVSYTLEMELCEIEAFT